MSTHFAVALKVLIFGLSVICKAEAEPICDSDRDTCSAVSDDTMSLGQKLILKQTEFYHLNKLSYSEDSAAQSIKMYNPNDETYLYYWFDRNRNQGIYKGKVRPQQMTAINSYIGHIFYFADAKTGDEVYRFTVAKNVNDYIIPPSDENIKQSSFYTQLIEKKQFYKDYFDRTGRPWLSHYQRPKPILFMYNANSDEEIGTIHTIQSSNPFWQCIPDASLSKSEQIHQCQDTGDITVNLESISVRPNMFVIENLLSDTECELVKQIAAPKLHRSGTGQSRDANYDDETRTSNTAWIGHTEHIIIDTIFRRTAEVLQIEEETLKRNVHQMQSVFYETGQEYKAHHDFSDNGKNHKMRFITILFYLNEQLDEYSGGETWFPKAREGKGIKAHPGKGNAVLFYDVLSDGNGDDLTLHEAVRVKKGTKWICNFWVWDPEK